MSRYFVSALTETYPTKEARDGIAIGDMVLWQSKITTTKRFTSFSSLRDHVLMALEYPEAQTHKSQTYGWLPSEFNVSDKRNKDGTIYTNPDGEVWSAHWRVGHAEIDSLSVFVADVDNADESRPKVTQKAVTAALKAQGWSCFTYSSFSSKPRHQKFRTVIDTTRPITRKEAGELFVLLNTTVFGAQGDAAIYDPADYLYAPPHGSTTTQHEGQPLDVDASLATLADLRTNDPAAWAPLTLRRASAAVLTPEQAAAHAATLVALNAATDAREWIADDNPHVVRPEWIDEYRTLAVNGSHWETMRSVMGKVWTRSGGSLMRVEMECLLRGIDLHRGGYFTGKYGQHGVNDVVGFVMRQPVQARETKVVVTEPAPRILDATKSGIVIDVVEGACGSGKTDAELKRIIASGGKFIYATEKIASIRERVEEFHRIAGSKSRDWFVRAVHSTDDSDMTVIAKLADTRDEIRRDAKNKNILVFVTHATLFTADMRAWAGYRNIIDEVPDVATAKSLDVRNNPHIVVPHMIVTTDEGDCYRLETTPEADERLKNRAEWDDAEMLAYGVLSMASRPQAETWVTKSTWDNIDTKRLQFLSFCDPRCLRHFESIRLLGDEAMQSVTVSVWREQYGVEFRPVPFEGRKRKVPMSKRLTVYYFSKHREASTKRLSASDVPLSGIAAWVAKHAGDEAVLWTANKRLVGDVAKHIHEMPFVDGGNKHISPRAHGINGLEKYRHVAFFAAMRPSPVESALLKAAVGIETDQIVAWREHNTLNQFIMRGNGRNYDGEDECIVYVFSQSQADYLIKRYGGSAVYVPGIIDDEAPSVGGRPRKTESEKVRTSDAQKARDYRARKKLAAAGPAARAALDARLAQHQRGIAS